MKPLVIVLPENEVCQAVYSPTLRVHSNRCVLAQMVVVLLSLALVVYDAFDQTFPLHLLYAAIVFVGAFAL